MMKYYLMIVLAMLAFASNSILCRMALGQGAIDAASFTCIRLLSGVVMLALILAYRNAGMQWHKINPLSALMLFTYATCFSFSYINIATGTGALILFGTVQLGLMLSGLLHGERPGRLTWLGIALASGGLVYLLLPGVSAPPLPSALLMIAAGAAWSIYTIRGKNEPMPLVSTGWNFIATIPLALITYLVFYADVHVTTRGLLLAEPLTLRLLVAGSVVLGGVYLTIRASAVPAVVALKR